jgi:hypothetical protein
MLRLLIGGGIGVGALAALALFAGHPISLILDKVVLVPVARAPASPVGWNGVFLQFDAPAGGAVLDLEGPGPSYRPAATASVDAQGRLVISTNGEGFVLGDRAGDPPVGGSSPPETIPAYAAEPGDVGVLSVERSALSRPVFELNFVTGRSPSWRRDVYYRLSVKKRSGQRLDLLWRFEQGFYPVDGWTAAEGTEDGVTGLIRARIEPASGR